MGHRDVPPPALVDDDCLTDREFADQVGWDSVLLSALTDDASASPQVVQSVGVFPPRLCACERDELVWLWGAVGDNGSCCAQQARSVDAEGFDGLGTYDERDSGGACPLHKAGGCAG